MWYVILGLAVVLIIVYIVKKQQDKKKDVNPLEEYLNTVTEVTEPISDTLGKGKVQLGGAEIHAYRGQPGVIDIGKKVKIVDVGLHKVKVELVKDSEPVEAAESTEGE